MKSPLDLGQRIDKGLAFLCRMVEHGEDKTDAKRFEHYFTVWEQLLQQWREAEDAKRFMEVSLLLPNDTPLPLVAGKWQGTERGILARFTREELFFALSAIGALPGLKWDDVK